MKKIASLAAAAAMVLLTAGTASAAWSINDDSTFELLRSRLSSVSVTNSNSAAINNAVVSSSNTGGNAIDADEDVENGAITSGDAEAAAEAENVANDIDSEATLDATDDEGMSEEDISVDDDSDLDVEDTEEDAAVAANVNAVEANNAVITAADSGNNTITSEDDDVEGGEIESGSASTASSVANAFNILRSRITLNR